MIAWSSVSAFVCVQCQLWFVERICSFTPPFFFDDFRSEKKICFDVAKQKGSDFTKICIKTRFFWVCRERIYLSTVVGWALSSVGSVRKRWKRKGRNVGRCCFVFSFCWVHSETIQSCCYYWIIVVIYMTFLFQILYTHTHPLLVKKSSNKIWLSKQFFNRNLFASASTFPKQSAHVISIWNSLVISLPPSIYPAANPLEIHF